MGFVEALKRDYLELIRVLLPFVVLWGKKKCRGGGLDEPPNFDREGY